MKCPYCGNEMENGKIKAYEMFNPFAPATTKFIPDNKAFPNKKANVLSESTGYYCNTCNKIIAVYKAN